MRSEIRGSERNRAGIWNMRRSGMWLALVMSGLGSAQAMTATSPATTGDSNVTGAAAVSADSDSTDPKKVTNLSGVQVSTQAVGYVATRSTTGSKTDSPIIDNPQSISIVTRQQMDDQGAQTVDQALRYTTGVYTQDGTDVRFDQLSARGFSMDSYLDGLHLYQSPRFATPRVDPYLLDQIDVLRGPSSVLYGQGNPGGLVNYVSKLPTDTPHNEVMLQLGNNNYRQLGFDIGSSNQDGTVSYRVVGLAREANTQVDQIKDHRFAIAPSLTFRLDSDTSITLLGGYQRDPEGGQFNPVPASGTLFYNPNGKLGPDQYFGNPDTDHMSRTQYWLGEKFEHRFDDVWSFSQSARYLHIDEHYYQTSVTSNYLGDNRTVMMFGNRDNEQFGQFTTDAHAQAKFATGDVQHTVLLGGDYTRLQLYDRVGQAAAYYGAVVGRLNLFAPDYRALTVLAPNGPLFRYSLWQGGVYAQDEMRYQHWVLNIGGREDWTKTTQHQPMAGQILDKHADDQQFTWRAGLAYEFANGLVPYVSYTTSFQPGIGTTAQGTPFKPTEGKQYEAGIRYQPIGYQAYFTLAAYDLRQQNVATTSPDNPNLSIQAGVVRSRGIEAEAHVNLGDNLRLLASYTTINQRITADTRFRGKRPPGTPRQTASVWLDYTVPGGWLRNVGFGAGVRYVSSAQGDVPNTFEVPGRTLMDVAAHYDWQHWRLALNVSNLFDREYVSTCSSPAVCYWGATRTVLATARYQW